MDIGRIPDLNKAKGPRRRRGTARWGRKALAIREVYHPHLENDMLTSRHHRFVTG